VGDRRGWNRPVTTTFPEIDRDALEMFVRALFPYANAGYVQFRAFFDNRNGAWRPNAWPAVKVEEGPDAIVEAAIRFARECAASREPIVFAPPLATFKDATKAAEKDIALGICLSVECDQRPNEARDKLAAVLGPPTIAMASGGEWTDPASGEVQPKLHLHWRLAKPTREFAEHVALKEARRAAMSLIGADPSGVPLVHPMRWAGTWHRKLKPKLATIVEWNADIEIELADAVKLLKAAKANGFDHGVDASNTGANPPSDGTRDETAQLIVAILRAEDYHDPIAKLAMRFLLDGMADSKAVELLRGIMLAVYPARRDWKGGTIHKDRWQSRYTDIPRAVRTARSKIDEAAASTAAPNSAWPDPTMLLSDELSAAPQFPVNFLPGAICDFACDVTDRMQCPVDIVAIPLIISAAALIGKGFRLAPKARDDWTERACLWGGVIMTSGAMKSPGFQKALRPIRWLQSAFHKRHEAETEAYKEKFARFEYAERQWKEACKRASKVGKEMPEKPEPPEAPQLRRLLTADATQEALVDLIEKNSRGLMLFRDELSGWFSSFNQYRPGSDRQFFLECHAGGSFPKDRRRGSAWIEDLFLNICGGLQPEIIRTLLAGGDIDGMAARFSLLVWPDRFDEFRYIDQQANSVAEHKTEVVMKKLLELEPEAIFGPARDGVISALRFDTEAQPIFVEWYTKNQLRIRKGNEPPAFSAHLSKYAGLFARLAIVHHLVRYILGECKSPTLVETRTAAAVETFIDDYLEPHARRIYRHLGTDPIRDGAQLIARWIVDNPSMQQFTAREVRRHGWSGLTAQPEVNLALDYLENVASWIRCTVNLPGPQGGRPSSIYLVNPLVRR
jgi:Protein of unknown function (DUF3987)